MSAIKTTIIRGGNSMQNNIVNKMLDSFILYYTSFRNKSKVNYY